jgi:hypothetical protein
MCFFPTKEDDNIELKDINFFIHQGDQIGRIFACQMIVYFGPFLNILNRSSQKFLTTSSLVKASVHFDTTELGYILGDLFTNSSGHPAIHFKMIFTKILVRMC